MSEQADLSIYPGYQESRPRKPWTWKMLLRNPGRPWIGAFAPPCWRSYVSQRSATRAARKVAKRLGWTIVSE